MFYVFHVDTGTMMTFEMKLALESVANLKLNIEKMYGIPASAQVLLVSGGEVLRPDNRVCSYSAGTDTNPIYMFSKNIMDSSEPPPSFDFKTDVDLSDQVKTCLSMAAKNSNYSTVVACSSLAQRFYEVAREYTHNCEKLVHDQHLQQQGWAAVVANMEDVVADFHERSENFKKKFNENLEKKEEYTELLSTFDENLEILSSIPILPALRRNAASNPFTAFDDLNADSESSERHASDDEASENKLASFDDGQKETVGQNVILADIQATTGSNEGSSKTSSLQGAGGSTASEGDEDPEAWTEGAEGLLRGRPSRRSRQGTRETLTLLHWIMAKENQESLKDIARYCRKALELLDSSVMQKVQKDVAEAMKNASQEAMKKINGLEDRLYGLEQLMMEAKRMEQEQKDLAASFVQNQQKAANLCDVSVLRMFCESHCQQLKSMLRNQQKLTDVRGRCSRAKSELAGNLYSRLKWIVYIENVMYELDSQLMFYHHSLTRLKRQFAIIRQLHEAPKLFCTAMQEVVRRRTFSQAFLSWASDLARQLMAIHEDEISRRKSFEELFSGHFLRGLFPGTEDSPPPFAISPPPIFDNRLPSLTPADLQILTLKLPNLTPLIPPQDMTSVTQFFQLRSLNPEKSVEPQIADERILAVVREVAMDRGVESETDTEEFEKVGQSPMFERSTGTSATAAAPAAALPPLSCDACTLTEDNLGSQRNEVDSLKEKLSSVTNTCSQSIFVLRNELGKLKSDTTDNQLVLKNQCNDVLLAWDKCNKETAIRERETLQRLTVDHELELNDINKTLAQRDDEIRSHKLEYSALQQKYDQMLQDMNCKVSDLEGIIRTHQEAAKEYNRKLEELEISKQKALKELQEKMSHELKDKLESLRSRFRLVAQTNMDRSPSESSLEKIERPDMIEITNHIAILMQTKENMEIEKVDAIKTALKIQEEEWKTKLDADFGKRKSLTECEQQTNLNDVMKRIMEEKDRQLEQSREREHNLMRECQKYRDTIHQLSDPETNDLTSINFLQARIDTLSAEKCVLEKKVSEFPNTCDKELQTDGVELKDSATNPDLKNRQKLSKSQVPISLAGLFSSTSCNAGDTVLIVWNQELKTFSVVQDSLSPFLLHIDCIAALDLKKPLEEDNKVHYYIGKVESKDYCIAVKIRNRYNVPERYRFYRVKVRPLKSSEIPAKDLAFCCDISILKEKESSHSRGSAGMSVSLMAGRPSSPPKIRESAMTKSVCLVNPEASTSRRSDEITGELVISEDAEEQIRNEQPDSLEVQKNSSFQNDDQQVPCVPNSCNVQAPLLPEESVPYEVTKDGSIGEDSEVAEEAAP